MTTATATRPASRAASLPSSATERDGAVRQGGITVVTAILPGHTEELRTLLRCIDRDEDAGTDVEDNTIVPFGKLTRVHFARWLVFDEATEVRGRTIPATLVFCSNYDEPLQDHLAEMIRVAGPGLDRIYGHCAGYPSAGHQEPAAVAAYLRNHCRKVDTFYNGTYGKSVDQIRREARLRQAIGEFLDERAARPDGPPRDGAEVHRAVVAFVRGRPDLEWALTPPRATRPPFPGGPPLWVLLGALVLGVIAALVGAPMATLSILAVVLVVALLFTAVLLIHERRDDATAWTEKHRPKKPDLARREDRVVQNQLSSVINIKPGLLRAVTLRGVLFAINVLARLVFYKGKLGTIPSIHFARWVIVDDGRRLAFFSNFDGSWESYLGEFVDKASTGLTAVWSNCVAFPRTRLLVTQGAANEQAFKSYARDRQVVTDVWYSAYKTLTVLNITNNSELRRGLSETLGGARLEAWLRRL
ncbi:MAG: hypothetical protein WEA24_13465 [Gemmatimonadota bacterium]